MRIRLAAAIALIALLSSSCMSVALRAIGAYREHNSVTFFSDGDKMVAFIPMIHVGKKEFYADTKSKVDSLQHNGYIVFMESVRLKNSLTAPQKDTLQRKIRRLMGVDISKKGYLDTINGTIMGRKFKNRQGLTNQPRYYKLGVDTLKGRVEDVPINILLQEYEKQHGKIQLSDCDYTTTFDKKYTCPREATNWMSDFALGYRNKHLAAAVVSEPHKKIAILYGARHEGGLLDELKKLNSSWVRRDDLYRAK